MARWMRFLVLAVLLLFSPCGAWAEEADGLDIVKNDSAQPITPSVAAPSAAACVPDAPAPAGKAQSDNEKIAALQRQVEQLQRQIEAMTAPQTQAQPQPQPVVKDMMIRIKNLPSGSYRERCFSCMTMPDEDGERVLTCTCPVGQYMFERLSLNLTGCDAKQDISYCSNMLVCGQCNLDPNLNGKLPPPAARADEQDPGKRLENVMKNKK